MVNARVRIDWPVWCVAVLSAVAALAQVRYTPEGNTLPGSGQQAPVEAPEVHLDESQGAEGATQQPGDGRDPDPTQHDRFADRVDLRGLAKLAVFEGGRVKILDTLARETLMRIYGKERWKDPGTGRRYDPVFTYLDLLFNQSYYHDQPLIYIEVLGLRRSLVTNLLPPNEREAWLVRGRLTPRMVASDKAQRVFASVENDLLMLKALGQVRMSVMAFETIDQGLWLVSPTAQDEPWQHIAALADPAGEAKRPPTGPIRPAAFIDNADDPGPLVAGRVTEQFTRLARAWRGLDAETVNDAATQLSSLIPSLRPQTYPPDWLRGLEYVYNVTARFTIGHWAYFAAMIVLLIAFGAGRGWLIGLGVGMMGLGFIVHTAGIATRGVLAGRWPIHNQFESFMAICWFATLVGIVLMIWRRQWLFGAAAAALSGCGLLLANTYPIPSQEVGQVAGILATSRILYLHVNMVLFSYGLIALGFFVSLFYLGTHYLRGRRATGFAAAGLGEVSTGAMGVGGSGDDDAGGGSPPIGPQRVLRDLDQAQMVVLQLAFWVLGVGILLGAYWADHAWGRWWAWDPKETWALITWIIYLIVIHVRFSVKNRGLVTAWLSALGFVVMLWTYWGVNLLLAGLHSYA